ncbi:hypothetical protein QBC38DRAFT_516570 [Podospora fimiseda]|uniref:Cyanovirin-N domain-containing protein n=1 Tax=Podospora fimiseda TaxID=252190 RepID=A0AAN7BHL4_9PEZI|nr:hypothetical protein QBC38DRAFT_516570 [Podospora fimiseda]
MKLSVITIQLLGLVATGVDAWKVTAFDKVASCSINGEPRRRVITGAPTLNGCMTFDRDMPGTGCVEHSGGRTGGCTTGSLFPKAIEFWATKCLAFRRDNCNADGGTITVTGRSCIVQNDMRSFYCVG